MLHLEPGFAGEADVGGRTPVLTGSETGNRLCPVEYSHLDNSCFDDWLAQKAGGYFSRIENNRSLLPSIRESNARIRSCVARSTGTSTIPSPGCP